MKAIILCAGFGKRMKPYTEKYQKSMIPVHGKPLLEYIINGLIFAGFKDMIIVVGYRKNQIIDYFRDGEEWNINIEYMEQKDINGTGGAVLICEDLIKDNHFFLTWGDIIVSYKVYKKAIEIFQNENQNYILVANYTVDPFIGAAVYHENDYCTGIIEKPPIGKSKSNLNNSGVFIFSKEIFQILKNIKPSRRGEIELTEAINIGIQEKKWKIRMIEMTKSEFRGDFGNIKEYKRLSKVKEWLDVLYK
ncbi:MAG: nucleotidyltransferase family protein [Candidatus Hermodarchaeota archaeon]